MVHSPESPPTWESCCPGLELAGMVIGRWSAWNQSNAASESEAESRRRRFRRLKEARGTGPRLRAPPSTMLLCSTRIPDCNYQDCDQTACHVSIWNYDQVTRRSSKLSALSPGATCFCCAMLFLTHLFLLVQCSSSPRGLSLFLLRCLLVQWPAAAPAQQQLVPFCTGRGCFAAAVGRPGP